MTVLVFTTKDQAKDPKAGFNALFGKFGDALVVKVFPDGKIYSIDLIHSKLDSPSGSIQGSSGHSKPSGLLPCDQRWCHQLSMCQQARLKALSMYLIEHGQQMAYCPSPCLSTA